MVMKMMYLGKFQKFTIFSICSNQSNKITAKTIYTFLSEYQFLLSAAERRGTPVLLSASVSDNSGNSPQMAAPRRSREIEQSTERFHVGCDNRCLLGNEYGGSLDVGEMILILTNQAVFVTFSVVKIPPLAQPSSF